MVPATNLIPYKNQIDFTTCLTVDRDLTRTIQLAGVPFETLANEDINALTRQWFAGINSIGAKNTNVALWTHIIRRKINYDLSGIEYDNWFSTELNRQYAKRLEGKDFFTNELFISPVYRPTPGDAERFANKFSQNDEQEKKIMLVAKEEIDRITKQLMVSLRRYHPTLLTAYEEEDGTILSELARFYSRIFNGGESGPIPINKYSIRYGIQRNEIHFLNEIIEIEMPDRSRFAGILGIKAPYGIETIRADVLHALLKIPCEYILSQSLTFLPLHKADKFLKTQESHFTSTDNNSIILKELKDAREGLQAGKFGMGEHEFILTIYGDSIEEVNTGITEAMAAMEAKNLTAIRERAGTLITQYFSMLPGNFKTGRKRAMPISTKNFTSFFPIHNFMTGNAQGSQWGMPLAMLETTSGAPYFVNYHVPRRTLLEQGISLEFIPEDDDDEEIDEQTDLDALLNNTPSRERIQRKESGNYRCIGPNGSGKTVVQCLLRALTRKKHMPGKRAYKSFAFDKDCGQEIFILALGGHYFRFETGEDSGIAPFSLPNTNASRHFILTLAQWCAKQDPTYQPTVEDERVLMQSIEAVYDLKQGRRWSRIRDLLPRGGIGGLHQVLSRWVDDGAYAWVLDSSVDRFDLESTNDFGFDMTSFLENELARTPILMYILHKIDTCAKGSPYSLDIDEASAALSDPILQKIINNKARTIRKLDGVIGLGLQNAADACSGPIAATLGNQFPTTFIFPNASASRADYIDGLKLTEREFELVQSGMLDEPGKFLLKKGIESVVVKADLSGMNNILSILSGSEDNTVIVRDLIQRLGPDPAVWVPEFFTRRT
jgi:type IV secretion system protein VirB4